MKKIWLMMGMCFFLGTVGVSSKAEEKEDKPTPLSLLVLGADEELAQIYEENETVRKLEEKLDVDFSFMILPWAEQEGVLDRMFGSGELLDVLILSENVNYRGGVSAAVRDGVYWDLTDYVEKYMPNYTSLINTDDDLRRAAYDDDNRITGLLSLSCDVEEKKLATGLAAGGMIMREDWLEDSGLPVPETYEDWEQVLTVFKEKYGCRQPLYIPSGVYSMESPGFCSGMGVLPFMQMNGDRIEYGPVTEGWKDYVHLMHDWYEKGLIGSEFVVNDSLGIDENACIREETGAMLYYYARAGYLEKAISDDARFCAVRYPVRERGMTVQGGERRTIASKVVFVTKAVSEERLPEVLKILDAMYDPALVKELVFGTEGEDYTYDEEGNIRFSDAILTYGGKNGWEKVLEEKLMPSTLLLMKDWRRELLLESEKELALREIWNQDGTDLYVPDISLDSDEQYLYSSVMDAVQPYVKDMTCRMIVGAADIDLTWKGYVQTIQAMGIEDAVRAYQNAYNRYVHRQ